MFCWIGEAATRRPRLVLFGAFVFLVLCVALGAGAGGRLKTQGYDDPRSDSSFAARVTAEHLGAAPNLVVVVQVPGGFVDDAAAQRAGEDLTRRLAAQPQVSAVSSYWRGRAAELRSRDGRSAMLLAHVDGTGEELGGRVKRLREALTAAGPYTGGSSAPGPSTAGPSTPGPSAAGPSAAGSSTGGSPAGGSSARAAAKGMPALKVHVGGPALVDAELQDLSESDLKRAEAVVLPGTLILLVLVFGSVVAALLPLLIGVLSIAGTLLVLSVLGRVTDVSVFALNLTTVLGLGLGIDYGLLIVSRFREEITGGHSARDAALRTVRTAGHTIVFSAATVCAALATLLVFPPYFLRSFAYAGIAVVAIAAVAALTIMPALLTLLGKRVNAWPVPWRRRVQAGCASRWWEALARRVVRRPVLAAVPVIGLLAVLAAPFAHAGFATPTTGRCRPARSAGRPGTWCAVSSARAAPGH
ncbi:hypothetical protein SAV14893_083770 [Streptomyces avermitilis]|uniref:SSD domain-containing protein n=1 Tax=Streptomyces avermitilis TaxID=33903 RepID=A0A4D4MB07_STRAX|nr:hypothetical protein SAV14893_083770 [Streptomyces avermitilis]